MIPLRDDNVSYSFPFVSVILIAINVLVFMVTYLPGGEHHAQIVFSYGLIPAELFRGENLTVFQHPVYDIVRIKEVPPIATMFTSMFLHGDFMHIIGNMWFLWLFGDNVEDRMGKFRFVIFYLLTGLVATLAHALIQSDSMIPTVGASGAISGVLGAYIVLFPRAQIQTLVFFIFITVVRIPALIFIGFWFIGQMYSGFLTLGYEGAGVAFFAHIGGFLGGIALVKLFAKKQLIQVPQRSRYRGPWNSYDDDDYTDIWR